MATKFMSRKANILIAVNDGNIERALRQLKKKTEREGVIRDTKRLVYFEKASQKRRKRKMRAVKQNLIRLATTQF
jgi:small subunit ribosomal protein S21